ncbi:homoserine dehydrogenase [Lacticaseibacillus zhaodongensis]|uniref:homoserine dehydrogenase n=1 Tax=Lacticaseibacillus zhaodongensis TaxID=2668065 RepID=UPI0012D2A323|nr:homoserine dehydrogenase [Lacticaseibacillus zhaodongensis]
MTRINIGLLGLGTVGSGIVNILQRKRPQLAALDLHITRAAVRNLYPKRQALYPDIELTTSAVSITQDPDIDVVIEVMGGVKDTYPLLVNALKHGKHVVSANKDLLSEYGPELSKLAQQNHVGLYYEAAVTGAIPILHVLAQSYAGDKITRVAGIVNGTSNYILTQMVREGRGYQEALAAAQELGFAEADPTNDVEGFDAAYKLLILSRFAFGMTPKLADVKRQGITTLQSGDFAAARHFGYTLKPLAVGMLRAEQLDLRVGPYLVSPNHAFSSVIYENNAVVVDSLNTKEIMLSGPGAGSLPTANSIISDLVTIGTAIHNGIEPAPFTSLVAPTAICSPDRSVAARLIALKTSPEHFAELRGQLGITYTKPYVEDGVPYNC